MPFARRVLRVTQDECVRFQRARANSRNDVAAGRCDRDSAEFAATRLRYVSRG